MDSEKNKIEKSPAGKGHKPGKKKSEFLKIYRQTKKILMEENQNVDNENMQSEFVRNNFSVRLSERITSIYAELYGSRAEGIEKAAMAYLALRKRALHDLKDRFQRQELCLLIDSLNGVLPVSEFQANVEIFYGGIEDSVLLDHLDEKWEVSWPVLKDKLANLSMLECFYLQEEIHRFWRVKSAFGSPTPDLDKFLAHFFAGSPIKKMI